MTQTKVGWRAYVNPISSLLTSIYGVWNAEGTNNLSVKNAWNANGNAIDSKSGVNGTIAAPSGNTWVPSTMTYGSGKLGSGAFTFNGNNFISLPNNSLNLVGDFTISLWAYIPSTTPMYLISTFDNSSGLSSYNGWNISCQSNTVNFYVYNALGGYSNRYYGVSVPIPGINQWVHITVTKVVGQEANIYVNGVLGTKTITTNGGATSAMNPAYITRAYIGASYFFSRSPNAYNAAPNGLKLDAIQVWDGSALEQAAVTELYNSGNGQEYPFTLSNELIATTNDSVGTNNGTRPSSTLTGGVPGPSFTAGKIGKAFTFDGVNDHITLADNSLNLTGPFSYSFWFKSSNTTSYGAVIGNLQQNRSPYGFFHGYEISVSSGKVYTRYRSGYNIDKSLQSVSLISTNSWNHVVVTYNPGVGTNGTATGNKIYINGVLDISGPTLDATGSNIINYTSPMKACIGARNYNGTPSDFIPLSSLDALSVWNKELTSTEVTSLYNSGTGKQYPNY